MIAGVDSKPPSDATIAAAKADGVELYALYHGTVGDGIDPAHLASDSDFDRVRAAGLATFAFVSGNQDPLGIRAWSRGMGVASCVDVERFIRSDGPWVQAWLDASSAGLYGNLGVHKARRAAFYVLADYPGYNPNTTWLPGATRPPGPCGWQFQGTTAAYGTAVDRAWYDDSFGLLFGGKDMAQLDDILTAVKGGYTVDAQGYDRATPVWAAIQQRFANLDAAVAAIKAPAPDTQAILAAIADLKAHPAFDPKDQAVLDIVSRLEAAAKAAGGALNQA